MRLGYALLPLSSPLPLLFPSPPLPSPPYPPSNKSCKNGICKGYPSNNAYNCKEIFWDIFLRPTDWPTDLQIDKVSYRSSFMEPKNHKPWIRWGLPCHKVQYSGGEHWTRLIASIHFYLPNCLPIPAARKQNEDKRQEKCNRQCLFIFTINFHT